MAIEVGLQSDYRHRGYSLSDERPAGAITLLYDHPSGIYVGGSALATIDDGEPELLGAQANVGYAVRVAPEISLDGGLIHMRYQATYGAYASGENTEAYVGINMRNLTSRVYYSPDYFGSNSSALYAEIEGGLEIATNWHLSAHVGALSYLGEPPPYQRLDQFDWRLGASRRLGSYGLHLEVSGGARGRVPDPYYPYEYREEQSRTAVVIGATRSF